MLKMLQATERTEKKALSALNGNGGTQSLRTAQSLYRQIAALASELGRIERELRDSSGLAARRAVRLPIVLV
jgi:hypothetical protein